MTQRERNAGFVPGFGFQRKLGTKRHRFVPGFGFQHKLGTKRLDFVPALCFRQKLGTDSKRVAQLMWLENLVILTSKNGPA